jgi:hypothetical protein
LLGFGEGDMRAAFGMGSMTARTGWIVGALLAGAAVGLVTPAFRNGDASVYIMMADSLWSDHDLTYSPRDLERIERLQFEDAPAGLFLIKRPTGYVYAKPFVYPLLAAPWFAAFGVRGFLALNGVLLVALVLLGADILVARLQWRIALAAAAAVIGCSVVPSYFFWIDPFLLCTVLAAGALAAYRRGRPAWVAGLLVTLAVCRFVYLPLLLAPIALYAATRRMRALAEFAAAAAAIGMLLFGVQFLITRQWSPYVGERYIYRSAVPYQVAGEAEVGFPNSHGHINLPTVAELAQSNFYFFLGRFGGVLLYFPTLLVCVLWLRRLDGEKLAWMIALLLCCEAIQLASPHNMVGGHNALGNRFFVLLPVALVLVDFVAWRPLRVVGTALLLLVAVPVLEQLGYLSRHPGRQMAEFPHRHFPLEWTQGGSIAYPFTFGDMQGLTANQYHWEGDGVWTRGGTRAEYVFVRPSDQPGPRLTLHSFLPRVRVTDGDVVREVALPPNAQVEIQLTHPVVTYRDENWDLREFAVYRLAVETDTGTWSFTVGGRQDGRYLGVYLRLLPAVSARPS